jgi:hypothetical protein
MNTKSVLYFCAMLFLSAPISVLCMNKHDIAQQEAEDYFNSIRPWIDYENLIRQHKSQVEKTKISITYTLDEHNSAQFHSDCIELFSGTIKTKLKYQQLFDTIAMLRNPKKEKKYYCIMS